MILPRGEAIHKNLSTAFTDLNALLSTLKSGDFSGFIEINFPEDKGVIFIDSGEVLNAEVKIGADAKRMIGQQAIQTLLNITKQKDGLINIYQLAPERVVILAINLQHEILFKGLSTDFTHFDRLLLKLREEKHNGFIEVLTKEDQAIGVLFFEEGEPVEMFTTPESGPSVFGRKSIPIFVENVMKQRAIFNVYSSLSKILREDMEEMKKEAKGKKAAEQGEGMKEFILILQEVVFRVEKLVDESSRRKGLFRKLFKESLIERSEEYPFLDPFAGEFEFRNGTIQFNGEVGLKDFTKGIVECLVTTLSHLEKELPKEKILPLKLKAEIESSLAQHNEALKRMEVEAITSSIFK